MKSGRRYNSFGDWLRRRFGGPVRKVSVDAGFGCPHRAGGRGKGGCIYCDNFAFSPALSGGISEQISGQLAGMRKKPRGVIVYFQPYTNTLGGVDRLAALWQEALAFPSVVGLAAGTRPDCLPDDVLQLAGEFAAKTMFWLEVGVQSAHDKTLALINRGHTWRQSEDALRRLQRFPEILVCAHLIIGLPGETGDDIRGTADAVARWRPAGVKLHHLHVVAGTELDRQYREGGVSVLGAAEYAALAADVIERLPPEAVIQRLMGEVRGSRLVAPVWGIPKQAVERMMNAELARRASRQGARFAPAQAGGRSQDGLVR